ncbi:MAG TPA: TetR/AcrR family transcriptional regulator [Phycisphaerales bacterium]|nr:TetR/AcrR family transcriptional regulator [Phycisphaerales bacterium]
MTRLPAAQRKEQLLDTAVTLFAERGYAGATTADLAKAAGVTEPIIYRHFTSKKDLFVAVVDRTSELTIATWDRQLRSARDSAQRLRRLIAANPMVTDRGKGIYRVIIQAMMELKEPEVLAAIHRHVAKLHQFVSDEVERAQQEGIVSRYYSPQITAWTLLNLGLGFGIMEALGIPGHGVDDRGVHVRDLISRMMLGDKQGSHGDDARAQPGMHDD